MYEHRIIVTDDGSHTILHGGSGEAYHSTHGAITESRHVFIHHGLEHVSSNRVQVSVLEVGFGTGLNALLSYLYAREHRDIQFTYQGIEKFPLQLDVVRELNYLNILEAQSAKDFFLCMHSGDKCREENFQFSLFAGDLTAFSFVPDQFDLVYFDAFAPKTQPELWEPEIFRRIKGSMKAQGVLATYCAQGQFRRTLKSLGFEVKSLPGPPGKREMTVGFNQL